MGSLRLRRVPELTRLTESVNRDGLLGERSQPVDATISDDDPSLVVAAARIRRHDRPTFTIQLLWTTRFRKYL